VQSFGGNYFCGTFYILVVCDRPDAPFPLSLHCTDSSGSVGGIAKNGVGEAGEKLADRHRAAPRRAAAALRDAAHSSLRVAAGHCVSLRVRLSDLSLSKELCSS